jgi:hypothetical protein
MTDSLTKEENMLRQKLLGIQKTKHELMEQGALMYQHQLKEAYDREQLALIEREREEQQKTAMKMKCIAIGFILVTVLICYFVFQG